MFLLKLCQNSDCRNLWSSAFLFEHLLLLLLGMSCEAENKKKTKYLSRDRLKFDIILAIN